MGDRLAYFKHLRLGDFLKGPEQRDALIEETQFRRSSWSTVAVPLSRGAGALYRFTMKSGLLLGNSNSSETLRQFEGRKLALIKAVREAAGFLAGTYAQKGSLSIIEDSEADATTLAAGATAGASASVTVANGSLFAVNDYLLIVSGSTYDVAKVTSAGGPDLIVDNLANSWANGSPVYRLLYTVPNAFMQRAPSIPGNEPGTNRAAKELEWVVDSADDPLYSLS